MGELSRVMGIGERTAKYLSQLRMGDFHLIIESFLSEDGRFLFEDET